MMHTMYQYCAMETDEITVNKPQMPCPCGPMILWIQYKPQTIVMKAV